MDHADLVAEMAHVEHLSTQERLHLARRRRLQQLKAWAQREKKWSGHKVPKSNKHIYFSDSVMLLEAAARNDIDEVRRLLMKGVSPDSTNEDGLTALHQCCIDDNEEMMKLLIEYGANVNAEDSEKWTPLHAAATCGHLHLVRYLISRGSNLLAVNADGNMPYDICEDEAALDYIEGEMARRGVTQELIDETRAATELQMLRDLRQAVAEGQNIEWHDHQGATPLHIAAANGYLRVVEFLLEHNVATNVKDNDDWQPVHAAACWGHLEVLELLVQHGADLNAKTKHDETPADICEDPELRERIIQLRSEQETKRMQETKNKRVNRTQSNTRTQSVRRTSIRDKTIITKKDAVEEARRLAQEVFVSPGEGNNNNNNNNNNINNNINNTSRIEPFPVSAPQNETITNFTYPTQKESVNGEIIGNGNDMVVAVSTERRAPEGQDKELEIIEDEYHNDSKSSTVAQPTSYVTGGNGNINIHVSVTINAGTLSDLKKQRSQIRNNSPDGMAASFSPVSSEIGGASTPPLVQRFTGDTDDIVGDPRPKRCCTVS